MMFKAYISFIAILCVAITSAAQEKDVVRQAPVPEIETTKNYLLGPGDVIEVRVFGQTELNSTARIDGEGNIRSLPFLEKPIPAKCRNEYEVQNAIAAAYKVLINDPQVSVRIIERNSRPPASVFGAVRQPGRLPMQRRMRLNELIASAGGVTERAAGTVQILHTEPVLCPAPGEEAQAMPIDGTRIPFDVISLSDMKSGKLEGNPIIRPGDYVLVSEAELVYVTGSVITPGPQLLAEKLSLSRVMAMAGGTKKEADLSDVRIYRQKIGSLEQEVLKVNYDAIKRNETPDVLLKPYDVIEVREHGVTVWGVLKTLADGFRFPLLPLVP
jgi:polysaccharide biosynthesis/export protein